MWLLFGVVCPLSIVHYSKNSFAEVNVKEPVHGMVSHISCQFPGQSGNGQF